MGATCKNDFVGSSLLILFFLTFVLLYLTFYFIEFFNKHTVACNYISLDVLDNVLSPANMVTAYVKVTKMVL